MVANTFFMPKTSDLGNIHRLGRVSTADPRSPARLREERIFTRHPELVIWRAILDSWSKSRNQIAL